MHITKRLARLIDPAHTHEEVVEAAQPLWTHREETCASWHSSARHPTVTQGRRADAQPADSAVTAAADTDRSTTTSLGDCAEVGPGLCAGADAEKDRGFEHEPAAPDGVGTFGAEGGNAAPEYVEVGTEEGNEAGSALEAIADRDEGEFVAHAPAAKGEGDEVGPGIEGEAERVEIGKAIAKQALQAEHTDKVLERNVAVRSSMGVAHIDRGGRWRGQLPEGKAEADNREVVQV